MTDVVGPNQREKLLVQPVMLELDLKSEPCLVSIVSICCRGLWCIKRRLSKIKTNNCRLDGQWTLPYLYCCCVLVTDPDSGRTRQVMSSEIMIYQLMDSDKVTLTSVYWTL